MSDQQKQQQNVQTVQLLPFSAVKDYSLSCTVRVQDDSIQLNYALSGDLENLELDEVRTSPERKIGLWERTCFEFFIKQENKGEYFEFNFAPSGDWNCFHFASPNHELQEYPRVKKIPLNSIIKKEEFPNEFHLTGLVHLADLGRYFYRPGQMLVNLAAVILEPKKGKRTYWALAHQDSSPNFHNLNTFTMKL